jgi:hypothetical protein
MRTIAPYLRVDVPAAVFLEKNKCKDVEKRGKTCKKRSQEPGGETPAATFALPDPEIPVREKNDEVRFRGRSWN